MPAPKGIPKTQYHPTSRRKVIAIADVQIMQAQVVDSNGAVRGIVVWKCGPDTYWSETMDGLFDTGRRKKAPQWLLEQLAEVPLEKQFDSEGNPKTGQPRKPAVAVEGSPAAQPAHVPSKDTDVPKFAQA